MGTESMRESSIGKRIARLRLQAGMTQERLAREMGVSAQAVSKWENDLNYPDVTLLPPLAARLGITVDELLTGGEATASAEATEEKPTGREVAPESVSREKKMGWLHIEVRSTGEGEGKPKDVNVKIPLGVVKFGLKMASNPTVMGMSGMPEEAQAFLGDLDVDALLRMAEEGEMGTLVDVHDEENDVHIYIA